jgi:hypothetical protein
LFSPLGAILGYSLVLNPIQFAYKKVDKLFTEFVIISALISMALAFLNKNLFRPSIGLDHFFEIFLANLLV